jgi:hypothetical protein
MYQLSEGSICKWTHIKCVRWFLKKIILQFDKGFLKFKLTKTLPASVFLATDCEKCGKTKKDFFVECQADGCEKTFHSECIETHLTREIDSEERLKPIAFYCEEHST